VEAHEKELAYLTRLVSSPARRDVTAELVTKGSQPYLNVANTQTPRLNERVYCRRASDGSWCFWWPWRQPIGSADDLGAIVTKITAVLRSVERDS
jgi:hypothetical protein